MARTKPPGLMERESAGELICLKERAPLSPTTGEGPGVRGKTHHITPQTQSPRRWHWYEGMEALRMDSGWHCKRWVSVSTERNATMGGIRGGSPHRIRDRVSSAEPHNFANLTAFPVIEYCKYRMNAANFSSPVVLQSPFLFGVIKCSLSGVVPEDLH